MKNFSKYIYILVLFMFSTLSLVAQENNKTHTVLEGETVSAIATKYHITPYDLIKTNPDVEDPLAVGTVLIISIPEKDITGIMEKAKITEQDKEDVIIPSFHIVKAKETVFSLSKQYKIKIDDLFDSNPALVDGLKIGMKLKIPKSTEQDIVAVQRDTAIYIMHVIKPKETKWGICHKYGITEEQLIDSNPVAVQKMNIDDTLWIPKIEVQIEEEKENINFNYTYYEVKPQDTTYGISKVFGISINELREDNPIIQDKGLKIGMVLKIAKAPHQLYDTTTVDVNTFTNLPNDSLLTNSEKIDELDKIAFTKVIDVVLMLPFYLNKNEELIQRQQNSYSKEDSNSQTQDVVSEKGKEELIFSRSAIALEFYNGALYAIDSLKSMGLSVRLRVYDTKNNLDTVKKIMSDNDFSEVDVVIGPLYTENVEYVADVLKYENILVVSPLSKKLEIENRFNLVQAMPTSYTTKNSVLKEVISERNDSTNIVVFGGTIDSIGANFIKTRLSYALDSNIVSTYIAKDNLVDREDVYMLLDPNKDNVVIIASSSKILATDVITALNQKIDSLPSRAYLISNPKILKQLEGSYLNSVSLAYPADYFIDKNSKEVKNFNSKFRQKYSYFPNMFSYRGFDITYEMLFSLGSNSNLEAGILHKPRRGLQGKFEFIRKPFGGYFNRGVFMVQYKDWEIKDVTN